LKNRESKRKFTNKLVRGGLVVKIVPHVIVWWWWLCEIAFVSFFPYTIASDVSWMTEEEEHHPWQLTWHTNGGLRKGWLICVL